MFLTHNRVRMHDTDMAGILYFARQFRFAHDALEDFIDSLGLSFDQIFRLEHYVFVIVHAEADYLAPLHVGDKIDVELWISSIGNSSFTVLYNIIKSDKTLAGTAKTVHVTLDAKTRQKIPIPNLFKELLKKHLVTNHSDFRKSM
jgi:1,4-dihydroxy-2-naphthoyl-CoA hydrolase